MLKGRPIAKHHHHPTICTITPRNDLNPQTPISINDQSISGNARHSSIMKNTPKNDEQVFSYLRPRMSSNKKAKVIAPDRLSNVFPESVVDTTAPNLTMKKYMANLKGRSRVVVKEEENTIGGGLDNSKGKTNFIILCSPRGGPGSEIIDRRKRVCNRSASQESVAVGITSIPTLPLAPHNIPSPHRRMRPSTKSNVERLSKAIESNIAKESTQPPKLALPADPLHKEYFKIVKKPCAQSTSTKCITIQKPTDNNCSDSKPIKKQGLILPDDSNFNNMVNFMAGVRKIIEGGKSRAQNQAKSCTAQNPTETPSRPFLNPNPSTGQLHDATPKSNLSNCSNLLFTKSSALISTIATTRDNLVSQRGYDLLNSPKTICETEKTLEKIDSSTIHPKQVIATNGKVLEVRRPPENPGNPCCSSRFRAGRRFKPMQNGKNIAIKACSPSDSKTPKNSNLKMHHKGIMSMDFNSMCIQSPSQQSNYKSPEQNRKNTPEEIKEETDCEMSISKLHKMLGVQENEQIRLFPILKAGGMLSDIKFATDNIKFVVPVSVNY